MKIKLCLALLVVTGLAAPSFARPYFPSTFVKEYPALKDQVKEKKCGVCHPAKKKSVRNDYGAAIAKELGEELKKKSDENLEKFKKALKKVEKAKNADGKTFGELIEAGKLPGGDEPVEEKKDE